MGEDFSKSFFIEEDVGKYLKDGKYSITFPFMRGFSLTALVDCNFRNDPGRQFLVISHKKNNEEGEDTDFIPCIHTVVTQISPEEIETINSDIEAYKKILKKRPENNVQIINLPVEEKFKAFAIWTAGIAEAGLEAFFIQSQIEQFAQFANSLLHPLWKFIIEHDRDLLLDFLFYLERNCKFNGKWHITSLRANLFPMVDIRYHGSRDIEFVINALIHAGFPVLGIFARWHTLESNFIKQIVAKSVEAVELEDFKKLFTSNNWKFNWELRRDVAANPAATKLKEYKTLFSDPSGYVRRAVAANPNAAFLEEYRSLFNNPNLQLKRAILKNTNAKRFDEYRFLMDQKE